MKDSRKFDELLSAWAEFGSALASELKGPPSDALKRRLEALQDSIQALVPEAPDEQESLPIEALQEREALEGQGRRKTKKQKEGRHDKPTEPAGYYYEDGLLVPQIEEADEATLCQRDAIARVLGRSFLTADMKPKIEKAYAIFYGNKPSEPRAFWEISLEYLLSNDAEWREEDAARERHGEPPKEGSRFCAEVLESGYSEWAPDRPATGEQMLECLKGKFSHYPHDTDPRGAPWLPPMLTAEIIEEARKKVGLNPGRPKKGEVAKRSARSVVDSLAAKLRKLR